MVFYFVQKFFFGQHKSYNIYFYCRAKREIFFPEFNIRLYNKNSESDYIFFSSTKIRIFFSATLGIRIFFWKKNHNPLLQVKWSYPKREKCCYKVSRINVNIQCSLLYRCSEKYTTKAQQYIDFVT